MNLNEIRVAISLAKKELRQGWRHFGVFLACLILGVTVMAVVHSLSSAVDGALKREAKSLLGGDVELSITGVPATAEQLAVMHSYGAVSHVSTLQAMAQGPDMPLLVEIKAVDIDYPLLGRLELDGGMDITQALARNGVAVDRSILVQLGVKIGDTISVGHSQYVIRATIKQEPDRVLSSLNFGPRVILSDAALQESGLMTPFSLIRYSYRILLKDYGRQNELIRGIREHFPETSWRIKTTQDGNRTVGRFMDELAVFLTLSGLAVFLMGGVGIGSSVHSYLEKKSHTIAVMKIMGATGATIITTYSLVLAGLTLLGGGIGIILAAGVLQFLFPLVTNWLPVVVQNHVIDPFASLLALWYGALTVTMFSLPALLGAINIRPAVLFRSQIVPLFLSQSGDVWRIEAQLVATVLATLVLTNDDVSLVIGATTIMAGSFYVFWLCAIGLRRLAKRIKVSQPWLRLALGNIHRPGSTSDTVIFAVGISLTVLIALTLTEANFQARIGRIVKEEAPSVFLMDIQPDQREGVSQLLTEQSVADGVMMYPMIRGRIAALNGVAVNEQQVAEDVRWAVRSDRGLSYGALPPKNAMISQGQWWAADYKGEPLVSIDEDFLTGMRIKLGDTITFNILGKEITAKIANARHIDYTTFQINFASMLSPGVLETFPHTYVATAKLKGAMAEEVALVKTLTKQYPGVAVVRTQEAVERVRTIIDSVAVALHMTVWINVLAGLLVLASALGAMMEQRLYDTAILKVLGARRLDILKACIAEWMMLALASSAIAAVIGTIAAWLVMQRFRGEGFYLLPHVTLTTIMGCLVAILITGYMGNRQMFGIRPAQLLRNE